MAALGPHESELVAQWIRRLVEQGMAILLVSHDLHGVFDLSDRIVVMKSGRVAAVASTSDVTRDQVLAWMIAGTGSDPAQPGDEVFEPSGGKRV